VLRKRSIRFIALACGITLFLLVDAQVGNGQTASGSIVGTVKGSPGAVIPKANVTIANQTTNARQQTSTNNLGDFEVPFLPPGTYREELGFTGFETMVRDGIVLQVGDVLRVDATLQPGKVGQEVTVTAYDFVRNTIFNARDPFAVQRLPYHENQLGGTIGGPVYLPKIDDGKNRRFFFFSCENALNPVEEAELPYP
jgi:hypothetical protein